MQRLEVSGAVRPIQWSLGVKGLIIQSNRTPASYSLRFAFFYLAFDLEQKSANEEHNIKSVSMKYNDSFSLFHIIQANMCDVCSTQRNHSINNKLRKYIMKCLVKCMPASCRFFLLSRSFVLNDHTTDFYSH
jgi:hypothetical protein